MLQVTLLRNPSGPRLPRTGEFQVGDPGAREIRGLQVMLGSNFRDAHVRSGPYQALPLPDVPGS